MDRRASTSTAAQGRHLRAVLPKQVSSDAAKQTGAEYKLLREPERIHERGNKLNIANKLRDGEKSI